MTGGAGNDVLNGGAGNDTLTGGQGNDTYDVDSLSDVIVEAAGQGGDLIRTSLRTTDLNNYLNVENLTYTGRLGTTLTGNAANNVITGGVGTDIIAGGAGADTLNGGSGSDFLDGGAGNDVMDGGAGNDRFRIHEVLNGDDIIIDSGGTDALAWIDYGGDYVMNMSRAGASGRDLAITFRSIGSDDLLQTTVIKNQFSANSRSTTLAVERLEDWYYDSSSGQIIDTGRSLQFVNGLVGTSGNNIIVGYDRNDVIDGRAGMDAIFAGLGNDTARGGTGDDIIFGGMGNDILRGDEGNDVLVGDAGADTLTGGAGADEFWFRMAPNGTANVDTITDFSSIQGDKIALSTQLFRELNGHVDDSNFSANQTGLAVDADDRLIFDESTRTLYYDADGSGGDAAVAFVTLTGVSTLAAAFELLRLRSEKVC